MGQRVNAFLDWSGAEPLEGVRVELPTGWALREAYAVRDGETVRRRLRVEGNRAVAQRPLHGTYHLVLGLTVGEERGYREVRFVPLAGTGQPSWGADWGAYVNEAPPAQNGAFRLTVEAEPLVLRRHALPSLDPQHAYTLEFWLKTVGLDEVVLSTWDGDEDRPYPLEVEVDARGRLVAYRGQPGRHQGLRTPRPIADGQWHHVAFVHDPEANWTRLYLDGRVADSLRAEGAIGSLNTLSLVLGGRPLRPGQAQPRPFSGALDELRLWPSARGAALLRRTLRVPLDAPPEGVLRLGFDEALPPELLLIEPPAPVRVASDLSFAFPVEALEAQVEEGLVTLTWRTKDRRAQAFTLERSTAAERFEPVATVEAADATGETADGALRFAYADLPPAEQVLYYRVRQRTASGEERVSGALKLGMGAGEDAPAVAIVGNSPNPFTGETAVTFELARPQQVSLSVWDLSGTRLAVLLDGPLPAGRHTHRFEARGLPSGVYFLRLRSSEGEAVHKVTLAR